MVFLIHFVFIYFLFSCSGIHANITKTTSHVTYKANDKSAESLYQCGFDKLWLGKNVEEGPASVSAFPWLGILIYPYDVEEHITTVILIASHLAIATALDIDRYPKHDFRERSRVIFGPNCSSPIIRIKDYTFHPDFSKTTYSTMALLQLTHTRRSRKLFHICPPPTEIENSEEIYAISYTNDCRNDATVNVYKMVYVNMSECREFYRRAQLDIETMWPTHFACAKGLQGGHCIWRSGTALVVRQQGRWRLLGLGVYGPGCESPSRFLDYGIYHSWAKRCVAKMGKPSISRIGPNHLVLRRTTNNIQRIGTCDPEEMKYEIYTDRIEIMPQFDPNRYPIGNMTYNVTMMANVEYECIIMRVWNHDNATGTPIIHLRRWCTNPTPTCVDSATLSIVFYVQIQYRFDCTFKISAYGTGRRNLDMKKVLKYVNIISGREQIPKTFIPIPLRPRPPHTEWPITTRRTRKLQEDSDSD